MRSHRRIDRLTRELPARSCNPAQRMRSHLTFDERAGCSNAPSHMIWQTQRVGRIDELGLCRTLSQKSRSPASRCRRIDTGNVGKTERPFIELEAASDRDRSRLVTVGLERRFHRCLERNRCRSLCNDGLPCFAFPCSTSWQRDGCRWRLGMRALSTWRNLPRRSLTRRDHRGRYDDTNHRERDRSRIRRPRESRGNFCGRGVLRARSRRSLCLL